MPSAPPIQAPRARVAARYSSCASSRPTINQGRSVPAPRAPSATRRHASLGRQHRAPERQRHRHRLGGHVAVPERRARNADDRQRERQQLHVLQQAQHRHDAGGGMNAVEQPAPPVRITRRLRGRGGDAEHRQQADDLGERIRRARWPARRRDHRRQRAGQHDGGQRGPHGRAPRLPLAPRPRQQPAGQAQPAREQHQRQLRIGERRLRHRKVEQGHSQRRRDDRRGADRVDHCRASAAPQRSRSVRNRPANLSITRRR